MRLFWKLFCSMVMITALACSIGGFVLIDAQFRSSQAREVAVLYEENDLLRYALAQELKRYPMTSREDLARTAEGITINTSQGAVAFRLSGEQGETLGGSGALPMEAAPLTGELGDGERGWEMVTRPDGRVWLHAASPLTLADGVLYLENCQEITSLFTTREEQYRSFFALMLGLTLLVGALSLGVSATLLRPLSRLSSATRRMAAGELDHRVPVDRDDELGRLSADFNTMAARLEEQVNELTDAARRQEDFIGSFAHEIKTPLTSIIGYADLLRSRPASPEQVRESADYIFSEGRRLESLSRKLMDLIVVDKQDFPLRTVRMERFMARVSGALRPALEKRGIKFVVKAEMALIPLEPDLMETVCLNLIDNARKSIDGEGIIVMEGLLDGEGGYCIRITDNGKGIPEEELSRIAEPFYMVDKSRSRAQGGAGLGLALCKRIVELHDGQLVFQSVVGKGTRVRVHLKGGDGECPDSNAGSSPS